MLPEGATSCLFRNPNFTGSRPGKNCLDLLGTGRTGRLVELRNHESGLNFGDKVSSCYL